MKSAYKIILGLFLAVASLASAADVAPFTFKGVASASQQEYWDLLMKYKVFGTNGIYITGQNVSLNDTLGWFGTATGQLNMESGNYGHSIGEFINCKTDTAVKIKKLRKEYEEK